MKVCKFGGSSLADAAAVSQACDILLADPDRRIMVVSAPGKRFDGDVKVTDMLITCAECRLRGEDYGDVLDDIVARYMAIGSSLGVDAEWGKQIEADLQRRLALDASDVDAFMDVVKAAGEDNSARLVAAVLRARGCEAAYVNPGDAGMVLEGHYGNGRLQADAYERLATLKEADGVIVFPGFFGMTREGRVITFSRGGSDITGSILAAAVGAESYENFTDVDSVFAVDPRIVENGEAIAEVTFREMRELSYAGFSVLHDEAILPSVRAGTPIYIKNTRRPEAPGTKIVPEHVQRSSRVVGIASDAGFCTIFLSKYLMNREIGFGRRLLGIVEDEGLSFEHTPSGIDNMSVIVREDELDEEKEAHVLARIRAELDVDAVEVERGLALIMIVGEGMRYMVGLAARATKAFADAGVNIEMLNQGSSEISMMFGVKADGRQRAIASLYDAFFGAGDQG